MPEDYEERLAIHTPCGGTGCGGCRWRGEISDYIPDDDF